MQQSRSLATESMRSIVRLCKDVDIRVTSVLRSCAAEFLSKSYLLQLLLAADT